MDMQIGSTCLKGLDFFVVVVVFVFSSLNSSGAGSGLFGLLAPIGANGK